MYSIPKIKSLSPPMFILFGPKSLQATTEPMQDSGYHGLTGSIIFFSASTLLSD